MTSISRSGRTRQQALIPENLLDVPGAQVVSGSGRPPTPILSAPTRRVTPPRAPTLGSSTSASTDAPEGFSGNSAGRTSSRSSFTASGGAPADRREEYVPPPQDAALRASRPVEHSRSSLSSPQRLPPLPATRADSHQYDVRRSHSHQKYAVPQPAPSIPPQSSRDSNSTSPFTHHPSRRIVRWLDGQPGILTKSAATPSGPSKLQGYARMTKSLDAGDLYYWPPDKCFYRKFTILKTRSGDKSFDCTWHHCGQKFAEWATAKEHFRREHLRHWQKAYDDLIAGHPQGHSLTRDDYYRKLVDGVRAQSRSRSRWSGGESPQEPSPQSKPSSQVKPSTQNKPSFSVNPSSQVKPPAGSSESVKVRHASAQIATPQ